MKLICSYLLLFLWIFPQGSHKGGVTQMSIPSIVHTVYIYELVNKFLKWSLDHCFLQMASLCILG